MKSTPTNQHNGEWNGTFQPLDGSPYECLPDRSQIVFLPVGRVADSQLMFAIKRFSNLLFEVRNPPVLHNFHYNNFTYKHGHNITGGLIKLRPPHFQTQPDPLICSLTWAIHRAQVLECFLSWIKYTNLQASDPWAPNALGSAFCFVCQQLQLKILWRNEASLDTAGEHAEQTWWIFLLLEEWLAYVQTVWASYSIDGGHDDLQAFSPTVGVRSAWPPGPPGVDEVVHLLYWCYPKMVTTYSFHSVKSG